MTTDEQRSIIQDFTYRPDVDGLRAIAVVAVVMFHAGLGFPGGFVGVDVFFVISGFLITSLIVKDLEQDKFSLVNFWERRVRRIWPPLIVVVAATLVAGWFLLLPDDYTELGRSSVWQSLLGANVFFWQESGGYFAGAAEEKPLLHTWSLAVEEQFYLFLPVVLIAIAARGKLSRKWLRRLFAVVVAFGLLISAYGAYRHPSATFYLLPTRAWELAIGSLIAVIPASATLRIESRKVYRDLLTIVGVVGILAPCFLYDRATPFPGLAAAPPCFGTALVIWANRSVQRSSYGTVSRLLASGPFVGIGLISYSLYLWHWPVFAYANYWNFGELAWSLRVLFVLLSIVLALISWYLIEQPTRKKIVLRSRGPLFTCALGTTLLVIFVSFAIVRGQGVPNRLPDEARTVLAKANERTLNRQRMQEAGAAKQPTSVADVENGTLLKLGVESDNVDFVLWGDSHAKVAMASLDKLASERGLTGYGAILYSTAPLFNFDAGIKTGERDAPLYSKRLVEMVKAKQIQDVFLSAYWSLYIRTLGEETFAREFCSTIDRIAATDAKVWVLLDVPTHKIDVPKAMIGTHMLPYLKWRIEGCTEQEHLTRNALMYRLAKQRLPATFIDPSPSLLNSATGRYDVMRDSSPLYYDDNHLTSDGSIEILFPALEHTFASAGLLRDG